MCLNLIRVCDYLNSITQFRTLIRTHCKQPGSSVEHKPSNPGSWPTYGFESKSPSTFFLPVILFLTSFHVQLVHIYIYIAQYRESFDLADSHLEEKFLSFPECQNIMANV